MKHMICGPVDQENTSRDFGVRVAEKPGMAASRGLAAIGMGFVRGLAFRRFSQDG